MDEIEIAKLIIFHIIIYVIIFISNKDIHSLFYSNLPSLWKLMINLNQNMKRVNSYLNNHNLH